MIGNHAFLSRQVCSQLAVARVHDRRNVATVMHACDGKLGPNLPRQERVVTSQKPDPSLVSWPAARKIWAKSPTSAPWGRSRLFLPCSRSRGFNLIRAPGAGAFSNYGQYSNYSNQPPRGVPFEKGPGGLRSSPGRIAQFAPANCAVRRGGLRDSPGRVAQIAGANCAVRPSNCAVRPANCAVRPGELRSSPSELRNSPRITAQFAPANCAVRPG